MSFKVKEQVPAFPVSSLSLAITFYSRMGFRVDWQWPRAEPTHVGLRLDRCALMLTLSDSIRGSEIYYVVEDVRACYAEILEGRAWEVVLEARDASDSFELDPRSLQPPEEPELREHGHVDFTVSDPCGNRLTFGNEAVE